MSVAIYLRKSRADEEAEKQGEFETLSRHKSTLLKLAKEQNLDVIEIKEELVSGESIIHRPKMLELLKEVEENKYDAVLVMDLDRLGRGDMKDQGIILETFKESKTKIITPRKTYDLTDEFDEEYSEFEAFMARKELKLISRRMQRGRIKSVEEGNFIGTSAPFGYDAVTTGRKERILVPNKDADVVRTIFDLYINEDMGCSKISKYLNNLGIKTATGANWYNSAITNIIKNKVYCGYIQWQKKDYKKSKNPNKIKTVKLRPKDEWIEAKGKHEPLISEITWKKAQNILKKNGHVSYGNQIKNPLAGIVICKNCGRPLVYRPYADHDYIICYHPGCNKSSRFEFIEAAILKSLEDTVKKYQLKASDIDLDKNNKDSNIEFQKRVLKGLETELKELSKQKNKLYDLLERGIYDEDTFIERSNNISSRTEEIKDSIKTVKNRLNTVKKDNSKIIEDIKTVLSLYHDSDSLGKNKLLKSVIDKAVYYKSKEQKLDSFELMVHLKLHEDQ
ncbi:TPA: recombinase family protein [Clostridioides difficile]